MPDATSLLRWLCELVRVLRECPEIGVGNYTLIDVPLPASVLAHRFDSREGSILLLHNLADVDVVVDIGRLDGVRGRHYEVLADGVYPNRQHD